MEGADSYNRIDDHDFIRISNFIMSQFGIKLPLHKKTLLQCRLQKRLKALNMGSFTEYVDYIFSEKGMAEEVINMIDAVSTNKTDFFREPEHFSFLMEQGIGNYLERAGKNKLAIWRTVYHCHGYERILGQ